MKSAAAMVLAACLAIAGCTTLDAEDCRTIDWYWLGVRDGEFNTNDIGKYTYQCLPAGVRPDETRYQQGRVRGLWIRRVDHLRYTP
ncbi:MAG TPA: hypothetical protein VMU46_04650 [Burkholderiales bacterium]|nr:hypothetical protein [Burkholderiales bacterium]